MGLLKKLGDIGGNLWDIGSGVGKVISGDWRGFQSVSDGVQGLFSKKDAMGAIEGYGQEYKPDMRLSRYKVGTSDPSSAGRITQLGDVDNIPEWSRNQAVAMYYLNMINKITTQGSPRKGA